MSYVTRRSFLAGALAILARVYAPLSLVDPLKRIGDDEWLPGVSLYGTDGSTWTWIGCTLDESDINALASGVSPLAIKPEYLVHAAKMPPIQVFEVGERTA